MATHIDNRNKMLQALMDELVGPAPSGTEIDCSGDVKLGEDDSLFGPYRQSGSRDEIICVGRPLDRYGVGILYPLSADRGNHEEEAVVELPAQDETASAEDASKAEYIAPAADDTLRELQDEITTSGGIQSEEDAEDRETPQSELHRPSSMAVSFLVEVGGTTTLFVDVSGGRYRHKSVIAPKRVRDWWLRSELKIQARFRPGDSPRGGWEQIGLEQENTDGYCLALDVSSRPHQDSGNRQLITVSLVNRTTTASSQDEGCVFQVQLAARLESDVPGGRILPYPIAPASERDEEEESIELLYRRQRTFAVGHGCAADWVLDASGDRATRVSAECIPAFETPSVTADVLRPDDSKFEVSMKKLAGLEYSEDYFEPLEELVKLYGTWIEGIRKETDRLDPDLVDVGRRHVEACQRCLSRISDGVELLKNDRDVLRAFQLANHSLLLQQTRPAQQRRCEYDTKAGRLTFSGEYERPEDLRIPSGRGCWHPFQIAFILMSLRSSSDGASSERETVELIWFPTGGGKTEAYLGLAAFSMFLRRLRDKADTGVEVIMRYTLRLLTAQQFQRASRLICAMEYLRQERENELGPEPFSIGIWVGNAVTPTRKQEAVGILNDLSSGKSDENKFILDRCPWCGAEMGLKRWPRKLAGFAPRVLGYSRCNGTVVFKCLDRACHFSSDQTLLPIFVIDEDIYEHRPSLVIGTVDKFAMLAWIPEARALFALDAQGERNGSPPGLVIQDELHLISGPLGSMVGLYEAIIDELCTDERTGRPIKPKIVASTATIRSYREQVKALYARDDVVLFPPPGLHADDSFFSRFARAPDGSLSPGRLYVGVHAPSLRSLQTAQVRSIAALYQAPRRFVSSDEQDPWWTMVLFFNSLRELGTMLSLFQSHVLNYFDSIRSRVGWKTSDIRRIRRLVELTSRIPGSEVPSKIADLEVRTTGGRPAPIDLCLATCMIEVGIDIERLSLMVVNGQPRSTSQYIQVTSRVGRNWKERPGLIVTLYNHLKPRDRSHFEKFRSYHERLYAQVEPTSVTPFSPPVLERALHALMAIHARQMGDQELVKSPLPFPEAAMSSLLGKLIDRVKRIDAAELGNLRKLFDYRAGQWRQWRRTRWDGGFKDNDAPLLREAGAYAPTNLAAISWATPLSMRNVDAQCEIEITTKYLANQGGTNG